MTKVKCSPLFSLHVMLIISSFVNAATSSFSHVQVALEMPVAVVDSSFLSIAIDSSNIEYHFKGLDLKSQKFLTLVKGLTSNADQPEVYLRVGGTSADDVIFENNVLFDNAFYHLNTSQFKEICTFANQQQWKLIFDLNVLLRRPDGSWDFDNPELIIDYAIKEGFDLSYELGNEPDLFKQQRNITLPPQQLAEDFKVLRKMLDVKTKKQSKLYGPDIATLTAHNYFQTFLSNMYEGELDAITFHHYYSSSVNITAQNFTSVQYLDRFLLHSQKVIDIIGRSYTKFSPPPLWLGETSSTYGSGSQLGMSFVAGYLWLDKLGVAAQLNISVVIRQTIKGGHYSLLDKDYNPAPDYWISSLYKQLVGRTVLNVTGFLKLNRDVRVYAHCVNRFGGRGYKPYSVVLMILNVNHTETVTVVIDNPSLSSLEVDQYLFSPVNGSLVDNMVNLNGYPLKMINETALPDMNPIRIEQPIRVPPLRYGFYILINSYAEACTKVHSQ